MSNNNNNNSVENRPSAPPNLKYIQSENQSMTSSIGYNKTNVLKLNNDSPNNTSNLDNQLYNMSMLTDASMTLPLRGPNDTLTLAEQITEKLVIERKKLFRLEQEIKKKKSEVFETRRLVGGNDEQKEVIVKTTKEINKLEKKVAEARARLNILNCTNQDKISEISGVRKDKVRTSNHIHSLKRQIEQKKNEMNHLVSDTDKVLLETERIRSLIKQLNLQDDQEASTYTHEAQMSITAKNQSFYQLSSQIGTQTGITLGTFNKQKVDPSEHYTSFDYAMFGGFTQNLMDNISDDFSTRSNHSNQSSHNNNNNKKNKNNNNNTNETLRGVIPNAQLYRHLEVLESRNRKLKTDQRRILNSTGVKTFNELLRYMEESTTRTASSHSLADDLHRELHTLVSERDRLSKEIAQNSAAVTEEQEQTEQIISHHKDTLTSWVEKSKDLDTKLNEKNRVIDICKEHLRFIYNKLDPAGAHVFKNGMNHSETPAVLSILENRVRNFTGIYQKIAGGSIAHFPLLDVSTTKRQPRVQVQAPGIDDINDIGIKEARKALIDYGYSKERHDINDDEENKNENEMKNNDNQYQKNDIFKSINEIVNEINPEDLDLETNERENEQLIPLKGDKLTQTGIACASVIRKKYEALTSRHKKNNTNNNNTMRGGFRTVPNPPKGKFRSTSSPSNTSRHNKVIKNSNETQFQGVGI